MSSRATAQTSPLVSSTSASNLIGKEEDEPFMERWLVMPKVLYFMLNMFVYGFHSLLYSFFVKQWKFSYHDYGYATFITSANFFGAMIWSSLADKTGRYKAIIISTALMYTLIACLMVLFRSDDAAEGTLDVGKMVLVFFGFGLFNFFLSAAFPLVDAMILGMLSNNPRVSKEQFMNQRMFGAVGHFFATFLSMSIYGKDKDNPVNLIIFQVVVTTAFVVAVVFGVQDVTPVKHGHGDATKSAVTEKYHGHSSSPSSSAASSIITTAGNLHQVPISQALPLAPTPAPPSAIEELAAPGQGGQKHPIATLLVDPNFMFFMLFVACLGIVRSVTSSFQKPLAVDFSGGVMWKAAMVDLARMFSEIVVSAYSKYMKNAMGIYWVMVFSQIMGIIRLIGYGVLDRDSSSSYYIAWGLELLKGFSSGMVSSSAIPIASRIAPPGCENSAQGLFSGNYSGLSSGLGGIIAGGILHIMYFPGCSEAIQIVNIQWMFIYVAIGTAIVTLLMTLKYIFVDHVVGIPGFPRRQSVP